MTSYPNDPNRDRPYDPADPYGVAGTPGTDAGYEPAGPIEPVSYEPAGTSETSGDYEPASSVETSSAYATTPTYDTSGSSAPDSDSKVEAAKAKAQDAADSLRGPAADVAGSAKDAGKQVAETAKSEAKDVLAEGKQQGKRVLDEGLAELRNQAAGVQGKLADAVQALADELSDLTSGQASSGTVANFAGTAQGYTEKAATWLRDTDYQTALSNVRRFAARNPWGFLAIAAGAGLLVGRFARGLKDADGPSSYGSQGSYGYGQGYSQGYSSQPVTSSYGTAGTSAALGTGTAGLDTAYGQASAGQSAYDRPVGSDGGALPADYGIHGEEGASSDYLSTGDTTTDYDVQRRGTDLG